ncbi:uncharacterized protein [Physcomitrium patens]|uniref:uncharacterized protein isoform X2 n=1 Tax=Physcomitrium patens TaxID=3218 RepID=UPI000D16768D|nr:uncharacterized protein LOC112277158 isoform X1 [Physcomitrium patens]|eukprot:XP_024364968.1 uncharacterized protein LOC112277158 isoform X1 [Physcomitrella patens]
MEEESDLGSCSSSVAIPYKWEAVPGRPIIEPSPVVEPWMSPLRPPPCIRSSPKPQSFTFEGFEPDLPALPETQLAVKVLKKLSRLRRKSVNATSCFTSDAARVIENSGQLFPLEDLDSSYDSDVVSDQSGTPCSLASSESSFFGSNNSTPYVNIATPSSPSTVSARPSSCRVEDADSQGEEDGSDNEKTLCGPHESAWHQPLDEVPACEIPHKWQLRRSYSTLVPALLRNSTSSRSFKRLSLERNKKVNNFNLKNMKEFLSSGQKNKKKKLV